MYPAGMPRLKDAFTKRNSWKATDEWNFAVICHVALRVALCQRKVSCVRITDDHHDGHAQHSLKCFQSCSHRKPGRCSATGALPMHTCKHALITIVHALACNATLCMHIMCGYTSAVCMSSACAAIVALHSHMHELTTIVYMYGLLLTVLICAYMATGTTRSPTRTSPQAKCSVSAAAAASC